MADPTARFYLTAEDRTGRAFASAERNLTRISRNVVGAARTLRQGFGLFGITFGVRAFAGWVGGALKAAEATGAHAKEIRAAQQALAEMKGSSDALAVSIGTKLTPAFVGLGGALNELRKGFFPTQDEAIFTGTKAAVERMKREVADLEAALPGMVGERDSVDFLERFVGMDEEEWNRRIAKTVDQIAHLRTSISQMEASLKPPKPAKPLAWAGLEDIVVPPRIRMPADLKQFDFAAASAAVLNSELQEISGALAKMPDDLVKLSPAFNTFAATLREPLKEIKDEALEAARFVGDNFRDAFTGWLIDGELKFKDFLRRMAIQLGTSAFFNMLGSAFPGVPILGRLFGGSRASGGSAREGMVYKVHPGEAFFSPGMDGHVGATGGGSIVIHQTNTFHGGDRREQMAAIAENNRRLKQEIKAEIRDARNRGRPV